MEMTRELFEKIINTAQDCVFWKDSERRFVGVNQAFLDFYGFDSADILIGKTDEDMGWHSDPEPFRRDELMVLSGQSTYKVHGKCIIRGEERDIIASKRPLYDGNKIVGLVGSFVDVTDVIKRQNRVEGLLGVYTPKTLSRFSYFDRLLKDTPIDDILDPLTGIVSRVYAVDFAQSLIASGTPFSFAIIDLDNFKFINDTFGHSAGDVVLKTVSKALADHVGENGIVARYGGDELLLIDLCNIDYPEKKHLFTELYENESVLRENVPLEEGSTFVTCTAGCASFPADADNFPDLFGLVDKTLYIGKGKGRNCYIIYVDEKHRDIEMKHLAKRDFTADMVNIQRLFRKGNNVKEKLQSVSGYIFDALHIQNIYYADKDSNVVSALGGDEIINAAGISRHFKENIHTTGDLGEIEKNYPQLYEEFVHRKTEALMIVRIGEGEKEEGCLIFGAQRSLRIWQENEASMAFFLACLIQGFLALEEKV